MNIQASLRRHGRVVALGAVLASTLGALAMASPYAGAQGVAGAHVEANLEAFKVAGPRLVAATSANPG